MKILYICTFYHQAMIFRDSMDSLEKRGHKVLAFNAVSKGTKIADKYMPIMDEKVIHKECFRKVDRLFFHYKQRKIKKAIDLSICVSDFDLIHSHTLFNGGWAAYQLHKKYGIPYVISVRSTDLNVFLRIPVFQRIARTIVEHAAGVLFLSSAYRDAFLEKCYSEKERARVEQKSEVIPNGLESFWIDHIFKGKKELHTPLELLCVGAIDRNKNVVTTLKAVDQLNAEGIPTHLTAIGQVKDEHIKSILDNNIFSTVIPFLKKEELIDFYRSADVFVMPSLHETFGRVYAEAMTQGLPVVYTRGEGFDGTFADGTIGYGVKAEDVEEIAEAIRRILRDYVAISSACVEKCRVFDWDSIAARLELFYSRAL
ncbi:MAG: glycosyltransferase family 4 protein [Oscillospiraceae bacterium]|nr:glycosyltransferase family 4 protein [Oscillospiraceae bacterium]